MRIHHNQFELLPLEFRNRLISFRAHQKTNAQIVQNDPELPDDLFVIAQYERLQSHVFVFGQRSPSAGQNFAGGNLVQGAAQFRLDVDVFADHVGEGFSRLLRPAAGKYHDGDARGR